MRQSAVVKIILDTNVIVAGLKSRRGASNHLLGLVVKREVAVAASTALILEYEDVLHREGLVPGWDYREIADFLDDFCSIAAEAHIYFRWRPFLSDPKDDLVFECALAAGATHIVTYNIRDFRGLDPFGISVVTPIDFLRILKP